MSEQKGLMLKADRYLESARLLATAGDLDSAVSRAYYAAYFIAETLLDALGQSYSSHRALISAFGQEFAKTGRLDPRFHRLLIGAFQKRQQADYLAESGLTAADVSSLLQEIELLHAAAREWLDRHALDTAGQGPDPHGPKSA
ncbi:MAG: HEPN domain-containing protein [Chromatiaceae bacterium]